ncbi:MAG: hypothetical protein IJV64_03365 [Oscillospiraceae bacterium]|nr:hypothetical protein [Oscillospiraceae bacterium]
MVNDYGKRKCNGCADLFTEPPIRGRQMYMCGRVGKFNWSGKFIVYVHGSPDGREPDVLTPAWCVTGRRTK